jgi:hypothetical protein
VTGAHRPASTLIIGGLANPAWKVEGGRHRSRVITPGVQCGRPSGERLEILVICARRRLSVSEHHTDRFNRPTMTSDLFGGLRRPRR